ncbi:MAG: abortive infection family protein [Ignavibacteria bacterium]|nr:abortive infection family protein [Ignavibacteria bacterium]
MLDIDKKTLHISKAIEATFVEGDWLEIGMLTSTSNLIKEYPRLLRSLHWGDDDYKGNVIVVVKRILTQKPSSLKQFIEFEKIAKYLRQKDKAILEQLEAEVNGINVDTTIPKTASEVVTEALKDAEVLLAQRKPISAFDRVHTGLHGYLKNLCAANALSYDNDATANQLFKILLEKHSKLNNLGTREEEVKRIIRTSATIIDAMGTLRNNASLAHPNSEVLDNDEAKFAVNIGKSLIEFLQAKIGD